jgi:hypothetical protein
MAARTAAKRTDESRSFHQCDQKVGYVRIGRPDERSDGVFAAEGVTGQPLVDCSDESGAGLSPVDFAESVEDGEVLVEIVDREVARQPMFGRSEQ